MFRIMLIADRGSGIKFVSTKPGNTADGGMAWNKKKVNCSGNDRDSNRQNKSFFQDV